MIKEKKLLSGNEAIAQGAWEAGITFASAYPGTPSTEIFENLSGYENINCQWAANEKIAYEVAFAGATAGVRALYASKHVGINVAMDPLMTSAYMGVSGGFVAITADDPGMHSSQNEQDNRLIAKFAKIPLIEPSDPGECIEFIKKAYDISEKFDIPVLFRVNTRVSHSKENVELGERKDIKQKKWKINIPKHVMVPGNARKRHLDLEKRLIRLKEYSNTTDLNKVEINNPEIGIITASSSYHYVKETMPEASVLKLGMSWPFPDKLVKEFASKVKKLHVVEELEPFIEEHVKLLGIKVEKRDESFLCGELKPELIKPLINGEKKPEFPVKTVRLPRLCNGCPHERVFTALKKYNPVVAGDIGCYTLGAMPPFGMIHTTICMGGSVSFLEGLSKNLNEKVVGVIGDSTFAHTGVQALISAAYNGTKGILFVLDNSTTAMTGTQDNPATGVNLKGQIAKKLDIEKISLAAGADNVDSVNPFKIKELEKLIEKRLNEDALSVIITKYPCQLVLRKKRNG